MRIRFVLAYRQNHFFGELVEALCDELDQLGVPNDTVRGAYLKPIEGDVFVLVPPHEFYELTPAEHHPSPELLQRTIFLCAEQPGSWFFERNVELARQDVGAVFDISRSAVRDFRRVGIKAEGFQLGWTRSWARSSPGNETAESVGATRVVDALHLGIATPRRGALLAAAAPRLAAHRARLILGDATGTAQIGRGAYMGSDSKWELMRTARVLLNIHQDDRLYFEWLRVIQAICSGVVVISETSTEIEPLRAPDHLLLGEPRHLGLLANGLLRDEPRRLQIAKDAELFIRERLLLRSAVTRLADVASDLASLPLGDSASASRWPALRPPVAMTAEEIDEEVASTNVGLAASFPHLTSGELDRFRTEAVRALKDQRLAMDGFRRQLGALTLRLESGEAVPRVRRRLQTPSYASASPVVSVIIAVYNHAALIHEALDSAARSLVADVEIVVVDDGSTDGSAVEVERWAAEHPAVPLLLLEHPVNASLGPARNTALGAVRGQLTFVLDADNTVYPRGLSRLLVALDHDQDAVFAYGPLEQFTPSGEAVGLVSQFPWQPWRLRNGNYIDAMVLWRTGVIRELGGYTTDLRLYGWEDYDLFCRVAERELRGVFTPEVVARYRVSKVSMLQLTNMSAHTAVEVLVERHPRLLGDVLARAMSASH